MRKKLQSFPANVQIPLTSYCPTARFIKTHLESYKLRDEPLIIVGCVVKIKKKIKKVELTARNKCNLTLK